MSQEEVVGIAAESELKAEADGLLVKLSVGDAMVCLVFQHRTLVAERVHFLCPPEFGLVIDNVEIGMGGENFLSRFPDAKPLSKFKTVKGSLREMYSILAEDKRWTEVWIDEGRVTNVLRRADSEYVYLSKGKALEVARKARELEAAKQCWATRQHGWPLDRDMDACLRTWAASYRTFYRGPEEWGALAEWLIQKSTSDQRHLFAEHYNWDHGLIPLMWIASQPTTELATVLEMFWKSEPWSYASSLAENGFLDSSLEQHYDFLFGVKERIEAGMYGRRQGLFSAFRKPIAFKLDPRSQIGARIDQSQAHIFSSAMFSPIEGRKLKGVRPDWPIDLN